MRHLLVTTFLSVSAVTALAAGSGTGFFVSTSGHILTNAHVIDGAENILIQTGAGETSMARVLSVDASNDLALIKIEAQSKPLHIRSTEGLDKGAKVFTIGFPNPGLQGLEAKYTEGVISSFSGLRDTPNVMQVTVPIQPGNSGGPLIDDKGNVVGVVVSKINALAVAARQDYIPENVNFAVKSDYAIPLILGIPSAQRGVRRSVVSVRDVEAATVLIVTSTKDDATKQAKQAAPAAAPPPQVISPVVEPPVRRTTVIGPSTAENGCVIPIGFTVMPPLDANSSATLRINNIPATTVRVLSGTVREFQYRIRMAAGPGTISVDCPGCVGTPFPIEVKSGCAEETQFSETKDIRVRAEGDTFRALISGRFPSGEFLITGGQNTVRVESTPATAGNPFVMFKSEAPLSGRYCIKVSTPFGSKDGCS